MLGSSFKLSENFEDIHVELDSEFTQNGV
jgi:hypothetical protein